MTQKNLIQATQKEVEQFQACYLWLEERMPPAFFKEITYDQLLLITHSLMGFSHQEFFSSINLKQAAIVLSLDSPEADLMILNQYRSYGIQSYRTYVSNEPFLPGMAPLRIATLHFTTLSIKKGGDLPDELVEQTRREIEKLHPEIKHTEVENLIEKIDRSFLLSLTPEKLLTAIGLYIRAETEDLCQYEVTYKEKEEESPASLHIVLAWKNAPKHMFLSSIARTILRHGLIIHGINAAYIDHTLLMSIELHGKGKEDVWDVVDIPDFLRELITIKYFSKNDMIHEHLVKTGILTGNQGHLIRSMIPFIHQCLTLKDPHIYTPEHIEWDLCRFPELTQKLCEAFAYRFHPQTVDLPQFQLLRHLILGDIDKLDTGHQDNDQRRKNVFRQALNLITYTLKTNFYLSNVSSLSFRLDPSYLKDLPYAWQESFSLLPDAIFYLYGASFLGFHIRFKELSRGGLRTVIPEHSEMLQLEANSVFTECYNLAYTQHFKNKELPEGGAKGVIFLSPYEQIESELEIYRSELRIAQSTLTDEELIRFRKEQKNTLMYEAQQAFVTGLLSLINYNEEGRLKAEPIIDYWGKPEYIFLGPDENMNPPCIEWIAQASRQCGYVLGSSFITSKPRVGINHKEYGVTSAGVNVYVEQTLKYLGIDPFLLPFTVKMSGGPDGDVAGNEILNLGRLYPHTARLLAITDGTGTIYDPEGLDFSLLEKLFYAAKGISDYPPEKLHEGGVLLKRHEKRYPSPLVQQTLCWKKEQGFLVEHWLSGSETNHLLRHLMHQVKVDVFIPAGGRPRTLNIHNYKDLLDEEGRPTCKAIIEGANLYLDPGAREQLEKLGVLIIKDSSANKAGVICSSFEALCGLALDDEQFFALKGELVPQILDRVKEMAFAEAKLLLKTHEQTGEPLSSLSDLISLRINKYKYEILHALESHPLPSTLRHPLWTTFFNYFPPVLRHGFTHELMHRIPEAHQKAVIAAALAADLVYQRGLEWSPTVVDVLELEEK